jgi:hypothetical protein
MPGPIEEGRRFAEETSMAQPEPAKITCSQCQASYDSEEELREHMKIAHRHGSPGQNTSKRDGTQKDNSNVPSRKEQEASDS